MGTIVPAEPHRIRSPLSSQACVGETRQGQAAFAIVSEGPNNPSCGLLLWYLALYDYAFAPWGTISTPSHPEKLVGASIDVHVSHALVAALSAASRFHVCANVAEGRFSMDEAATQEILDQVPVYEVTRVVTYVYLLSYTALIYHYITTIDEEVAHIWPQPRWKLGKILFLTTRYSALVVMSNDLAISIQSYAKLSLRGCHALFSISNIGISVAHTSAEATLWLCLYALLEGQPRYLYLMILMLLGFTVPIQVLQNYLTFTQKPIPVGPLDEYLGFPCSFTPPEHLDLYSVAAYLSFTRTLVATLLGVVTLVIRYRNQRSDLLRVIKREGGLYLASSLVLKFVDGLKSTPHVHIEDKFDIAWGMSWLLINVFAERLLLSMRQVTHPGTRAVISTLVFNVVDKKDTGGLEGSEFAEGLENTGFVGGLEDSEFVEERHGGSCAGRLESGGTEMKEMHGAESPA